MPDPVRHDNVKFIFSRHSGLEGLPREQRECFGYPEYRGLFFLRHSGPRSGIQSPQFLFYFIFSFSFHLLTVRLIASSLETSGLYSNNCVACEIS